MKAKPIFTASFRTTGDFLINQVIFLINLTGSITKEKIVSLTGASINYYKSDGGLLAHSITSPLVLFQEEFLWTQVFLKKYKNLLPDEREEAIKIDARNSNLEAIIFCDFLSIIHRVHSQNPMYSKSTFCKIINSILNT